jgi:hypothetical protein
LFEKSGTVRPGFVNVHDVDPERNPLSSFSVRLTLRTFRSGVRSTLRRSGWLLYRGKGNPYRNVKTPCEKFRSLFRPEQFLNPGVTLEHLERTDLAQSDNEAADRIPPENSVSVPEGQKQKTSLMSSSCNNVWSEDQSLKDPFESIGSFRLRPELEST